MKLLLTSAGLVNREISEILLENLTRPAVENRVLVVTYAQSPIEEFYVNQTKEELVGLGFEKIVVANMNDKIDILSLGDFDLVYVCGGNTFSILNKLKETGLDKYIIQLVKNGAMYVGVSAGSIIAGPDIEIAGWGSEGDKNQIGMKDLTGFNLVNLTVFPHFHEELKLEIEDFRNKVSYKVFELTNDQAVFVHDSEIKLIGKI